MFSPKQIGGRSHCMMCKKTLGFFELIPLISFMVQRGRCRQCRHRLSLQYPIVEFTGGLLLALVFAFFNNYLGYIIFFNFTTPFELYAAIFIWSAVFLILLTLVVIDIREYLIPHELVFLLGILGVFWTFLLWITGSFDFILGSFLGTYANIFSLRGNVFSNHLVGALFGALTIFLIFAVTKGRGIGFGDVKLFFALGLLFGYPDVLIIIALSFIIGALISLVFLWFKKKTMKDLIPFGPFIALSCLIVFFWGEELTKFYFSLFII